MANRGDYHGLRGIAGGFKVRSMIQEMEVRMAQGAQIPAGPTSEEEARQLQQVKEQNHQSSQQARQ